MKKEGRCELVVSLPSFLCLVREEDGELAEDLLCFLEVEESGGSELVENERERRQAHSRRGSTGYKRKGGGEEEKEVVQGQLELVPLFLLLVAVEKLHFFEGLAVRPARESASDLPRRDRNIFLSIIKVNRAVDLSDRRRAHIDIPVLLVPWRWILPRPIEIFKGSFL